MSAALTRLREALQDPIPVRDGRRMHLTPLAERIRPRVRSLLQEIDQTLSEPAQFDAAASNRCFRILANDYAVTIVLSPLLEYFQRHFPDLTMEILPLEDHFLERLAEGDYDLAVRDRWSLRSARRLETLFNEDFVCIARKDHPRLSKKPTLGEFLAEGHVLISPQGRVPGVVDAPLKRLRRKLSNCGDPTSFSRRTRYCCENRFRDDDTPSHRAQVFGPVLSANLSSAPKGSRIRGCNGLAESPRSRSGNPLAQSADAPVRRNARYPGNERL